MKWILVHMVITTNMALDASIEGVFNSMEDCFWARERLAVEEGGRNGYFLPGQQAICIKHGQLDADL